MLVVAICSWAEPRSARSQVTSTPAWEQVAFAAVWTHLCAPVICLAGQGRGRDAAARVVACRTAVLDGVAN